MTHLEELALLTAYAEEFFPCFIWRCKKCGELNAAIKPDQLRCTKCGKKLTKKL